MMQQTLISAVPKEYASKGYTLSEPDDHTLVLFCRDEEVARWSSVSATYSEIERACRKHSHLEEA